MLSSTILKSTVADQLRATSRLIDQATKFTSSRYCSNFERAEKIEVKNEDELVFEPPQIFKEGEQEDILKIMSRRVIDEKLKKDTIQETPADIDWPSAWSTAQTFDPHRVPLPVYQGAPRSSGKYRTRLDRWQNTELIKVPNFLHLTPLAVKRQTDALKKFCTKWPTELDDTKLDEHYPVTIYSQDRVFASSTIRDPKARVIQLEIHINQLTLDEHARDKLIQLLDHRYDPKTGWIRITAEDCPFKEQNLELAIYQLTACFFESWKTEEWEKSGKPVTY